MQNKRLLVICGDSGTGKTVSLRNLKDQEGVLFINAESGKEIPFKNNFRVEVITDPWDAIKLIEEAEEDDTIHTVVIDSITFLMDMFESLYIYGVEDTRQGWQDYAQFFKELMQQHISVSSKRVILLAHVETVLNEETGIRETFIPVKGALKKNGLEAFFSIIVMARKMPIKKLEDSNELLNITKRENKIGFKHVFQTMPTKETTGYRIRGPIDMWSDEETFIDNDADMVMSLLDDHGV